MGRILHLDADAITERELALSVYEWLKDLGYGRECEHRWETVTRRGDYSEQRCGICGVRRGVIHGKGTGA